MTDSVEAALWWFLREGIDLGSINWEHGKNLAKELKRLHSQTCATCKHQVTQFRPDDPTCALTRMTDGVHVVVTSVPCRFLGNRCGAWEAVTP